MNGSVGFVPNQISGRGGVADDATPTSRQGCGGRTADDFGENWEFVSRTVVFKWWRTKVVQTPGGGD